LLEGAVASDRESFEEGRTKKMNSKKGKTGKRGAKRLKKSKKLVATKPLRMSGGEELPKES
jgi:hypothetical protein